MNDWKSVRLDDVIQVFLDYRGKTPKKSDSGVPLVTAKVVKGGFIKEPTEFVAEEDYGPWMRRGYPSVGDVVLTTEAPLGEVAQIQGDARVALAQRIITLRGKPGVLDNGFLKYSLLGPQMQHRLQARATGTTVLGIKQSELRKVVIDLPPLWIQERIADILGSLDDKIEANRAMNRTLETMAQALYREWFVDFGPFQDRVFVDSELGEIPEGWRVGSFKEVAAIKLGGTPARKKPEFWGGAINWINSGAVNQFRITQPSELITELGLKKSAAKMLRRGATVLAITGATLGQVSRILLPTSANQSVVGLEAKAPVTDEYVYHSLLHRLDDLLVHATGGAQQHVNKGNVANLKLLVPSEDALLAFQDEVGVLHGLINVNATEADTLAETRDYLLPKLLSGEVEVGEAEQLSEVV